MKYFSFAIIFTLSFFSLCATAKSVSASESTPASSVVSKRLESKDISEVIEIVLRLQMECQRDISEDVCQGVLSILAVLQERVSSIKDRADDKTIAFIEGLIDGVYEANRNVHFEIQP